MNSFIKTIKYIDTQEEALKVRKILTNEAELEFDIETTGLDPYSNEILLFQLSDDNTAYVFKGEFISLFKEILENKLLLIHNALFELSFLYVHNIFPEKIYDTFLVEQVIFSGYRHKKFSLKNLVRYYLDIDLDKTVRLSFLNYRGTITKAQIEYAAIDVMYLKKIKEKQQERIYNFDLSRAVDLENEFVKTLAYISISGMKVDKDKWINKTKKAEEKLNGIINDIKKLIFTEDKYSFMKDNQLSLFEEEHNLIINLDSNKDIAKVCKALQLDITSLDDPTKESVGDDVLSQYKEEPFISLLLEYRKYKKDVSTYGYAFLDHIHPITGRIHTSYKQMVTSGRTVSSSPNLNNIPSDKETRECFVAEEGNVYINADYSDQEGRLFANYSGEKNLISFYLGDFADGHSYVAKLCFPEELKDIAMEDVKSKRPDLRAAAKTARFAIYYGGVGATISKNLRIPITEGEAIYSAYLKAFPALAAYFKRIKNYTAKKGYILMSPVTRRKMFNPELKYLNPNSYEYQDFLKKSLNYPIQGSAAEMSKIALIKLFKYIKQRELLSIVKIVGFVYDEVIVECPQELAEEFSAKVKECMETAADLFCKYVPIPVEPEIAPYWKH
jgi:DNA polymerase I-like protein with 3'-5' exonuclease and polymerase domains